LAVRGVGAVRFGVPSALRGTPLVGYEGHCAFAESATVHSPAANKKPLRRLVILFFIAEREAEENTAFGRPLKADSTYLKKGQPWAPARRKC
jgi:hypothetical protein